METQNNLDLENSLKEFEAKSQAEQVPQTGDSKSPQVPTMVGWIMKLSGGAIKEQKTAEYILLAIAVIVFAISLYFFFKRSF